ncbi:MAG TPA: rhomboid family intramembrane serine protease [Patescibacteria group bacterium]|nr:rhomboid family intramembrane serine protease [Patescibacteria group bacterium]
MNGIFGPGEIVSILIIAANGYLSYRGFSDRAFFERYIFHIERIVSYREPVRIVSSAFLHANWPHLIFNMFALYTFSAGVQRVFGIAGYLLIYFGSLVAGSLLALYIHRGHGAYRAVGASGAVSGVVFASIVAYPHSSIMFLLLPVPIPAWLFGIGFVLISIFGIGVRAGNIGHEAHLGGAIAGVVLALLLRPELATMHPWIVMAIVIPMAAFLIIAARNPALLRIGERLARKKESVRRRYDASRRRDLQEEMDRLLDKVNERGVQGITPGERRRLQEIADEKNRMGW